MKLQDSLVIFAFIVLSGIPGPILMFIKRKNKIFHTPNSYFLGNRDLPPIATAISLFMSFSPLVLITDFPVEIYNRGAAPFLRCIGQSVGVIIAALLFVPMLFRLKLVTTYEYAEKRYAARALRYTSSTLAIVISIINNALVTYSLCLSLVVVTPLPIWAAAILVTAKATFSAGAGGIQAVVWTNVVHFITMFACLSAVVAISFQNFDEGISEAFHLASEGGRLNFLGHSLDPRDDFTIWTTLFPAIVHHIGLLFSQTALSRYASFPTMSRCLGAVLSIVPQTLALHVLLLMLAVSMYASYSILGCDPEGLGRRYSSGLTSHFVEDFLRDKYPGIVGAWMVTLMASTLSTLSASVNATVGLVWHDFIGDYLEHKLKEKKLQTFLKLVTIFIGLISLALALLMWRFPPGYIKLLGKITLILSAAFYLLHIAGAIIPFINRPGIISAILLSFLLTSALVACQFYYGFTHKPSGLPVPRENCEAIIANLTATTPRCNYTTQATRQPTTVSITNSTYFNKILDGGVDLSTTASKTTTALSTTQSTTLTNAISTIGSTRENEKANRRIIANTPSTTTLLTEPQTKTSTTSKPLEVETTTTTLQPSTSELFESTFETTTTEEPFTTTTNPSSSASTSPVAIEKTNEATSRTLVNSTNDLRFRRNVGDKHTTVKPLNRNAAINGSNATATATAKHRGAHLPIWFQYILSLSYFFYPMFTIVFGFILAILISLCTGGLKQAKFVGADCLAVPNCFADPAAPATVPGTNTDAEMWLLSSEKSGAKSGQQVEQANKQRRVYKDPSEYARSVNPATPAMMLDEAAKSGNRSRHASNENILQAVQQTPAVSIYGHLGKDGNPPASNANNNSNNSRFALNAGYQPLPFVQPTQAPQYYEDERDPGAPVDYNGSSGTPDSDARTISTFYQQNR